MYSLGGNARRQYTASIYVCKFRYVLRTRMVSRVFVRNTLLPSSIPRVYLKIFSIRTCRNTYTRIGVLTTHQAIYVTSNSLKRIYGSQERLKFFFFLVNSRIKIIHSNNAVHVKNINEFLTEWFYNVKGARKWCIFDRKTLEETVFMYVLRPKKLSVIV